MNSKLPYEIIKYFNPSLGKGVTSHVEILSCDYPKLENDTKTFDESMNHPMKI